MSSKGIWGMGQILSNIHCLVDKPLNMCEILGFPYLFLCFKNTMSKILYFFYNSLVSVEMVKVLW